MYFEPTLFQNGYQTEKPYYGQSVRIPTKSVGHTCADKENIFGHLDLREEMRNTVIDLALTEISLSPLHIARQVLQQTQKKYEGK
jgi:hypothetical protein